MHSHLCPNRRAAGDVGGGGGAGRPPPPPPRGVPGRPPAVESVSSFIGVDGVNTTLNNGRVFINLKPRSERGADVAEIMQRLQPRIARVQGISLYMQPVQDLTIEDRVSRTQYQLTVEDANPDDPAP